MDRYSRQTVLPQIGDVGQAKFKSASVLVVGAGGLGCPALTYLVCAGVGRIGIIDADKVALSNLHRQPLYGDTDIGDHKVFVAKRKLEQINKDISVKAEPKNLGYENIERIAVPYDLLLDCTDNFTARYLINDYCVLNKQPFVTAAVQGFSGQVMSVRAGSGGCYRCMFSVPVTGLKNCAEAGVLGALVGMIGALQAQKALQIILGIQHEQYGELSLIDGLSGAVQILKRKKNTDCILCGETASILSLKESAHLARIYFSSPGSLLQL